MASSSFYNVSDGCLYFVDSENNAIRRADMTRRLVETMYPNPKSSGNWDRILGTWSWILNYFGLAKDDSKTKELGFDLIAPPWHMLNVDDDELIIISHSFAVAWTMSMTTWKLKQVIRGRWNIKVNVEIPKEAALAAPLDENCIWRQARGSAAEVSVLEEDGKVDEKVGVAQQWFDELDNLAFTNPELRSQKLVMKFITNLQTEVSKIQGRFISTVLLMLVLEQVIVSAALYLKPNSALIFEEAASFLNQQSHENGVVERESFNLFLEKCVKISEITFTKPLHLRIKLDCGDHPAAPTSKETILTDTRLEVNVTIE